jgi:hypothetical protein
MGTAGILYVSQVDSCTIGGEVHRGYKVCVREREKEKPKDKIIHQMLAAAEAT